MLCDRKEVDSHNELGHTPRILWPRKEKHDRGWQNGLGIDQKIRFDCRWRFLRGMHHSMILKTLSKATKKKEHSSVPAYFWKSGFDAWKSILTLSKGATTVFAYVCNHISKFTGQCDVDAPHNQRFHLPDLTGRCSAVIVYHLAQTQHSGSFVGHTAALSPGR